MSNNTPIRVYYLSSGRLGIHVLEALLHDDRINLVGIGSQPDKPSGRKKIPTPTPVAAYAEEQGCIVDKFPHVNSPEVLDHLRELNLDFLVVASFGQLLRPALLDIPRLGCFNVHASLLPKYRGASPITEAILRGEHQTGISFMKMDPGLDTGPVYRQCPVDISGDDTTDSLENKLGICAADAIAETLALVADGALPAIPQNHELATYAGKIQKARGAISWNQPAAQLERTIRAYYPWPTVFLLMPTTRGVKRVQITRAQLVATDNQAAPGTVLASDKTGLTVACAQDAIKITRLVPEGRTEQPAPDFLRGNPLPPDIILTDYPLED